MNQDDMETLVDLLDIALTSDDPRVQDQLKKLLFITTLIAGKRQSDPDTDGPVERGPIGDLYRRIEDLERANKHTDMSSKGYYKHWYDTVTFDPNYNTTFTYTDTTGSAPTGTTSYIVDQAIAGQKNFKDYFRDINNKV